MNEGITEQIEQFPADSGAKGISFENSGLAITGPRNKTELRVRKVELVVRCQELARFLRGFEELTWAVWIEECITLIRKDSAAGAEKLLAGYCGIGSVSDVYLCPEAGHRLNVSDEIAINEQFLLMLSKVNNLAREIHPWKKI